MVLPIWRWLMVDVDLVIDGTDRGWWEETKTIDAKMGNRVNIDAGMS